MKVLVAFALVVALVFGFGVLMAFPVKWLWNYGMVQAVEGVRPIGFWHAMCLNILCGLLFKASASKKE